VSKSVLDELKLRKRETDSSTLFNAISLKAGIRKFEIAVDETVIVRAS
ncbi:hypothetical protein AT1G27565, partial [Arabidopsis thaliana]